MVGAAENPFRVERIEALPWRARGFEWEEFLARLERPGVRGAVVGPHGSGKTTLLLEAQARLARRGVRVVYGFLNEETAGKGAQARALIAAAPRDALVFLDGAEQLDPVSWWLLRRGAASRRGLVTTLHQPGRLPTILTTGTDEALLRELLEHLVPGAVERYWPLARAHFQRRGGNIRDVFFALYDDCAAGRV